jgi:DNA transposition AAA+ family ATPase
MKDFTTSGIDRALQNTGNSAHSRINLPLSLHNWKDVDEKFHDDLLWFHQHLLDQGMNWDEAGEAVNYSRNSVYQFLRGMSQGSYENFCKSIRSYKRIVEERATIQRQAFAENTFTRLIFSAFDYALANNCMMMVVGESGLGKSTAMQAWRDRNNHGRSVYVDTPPAGGLKGFLAAIAARVGANKNAPIPQMLHAVTQAFNPNRILLLDNLHRAIPADPRSAPKIFDVIQYIFDETSCSVGISATARLDGEMRSSTYMFEQFTGRIGTPIYLPVKVKDDDFLPIVEQYFSNPTEEAIEIARRIVNAPGHIRQLVERLKTASRIANKAKENLNSSHFAKAEKVRRSMSRHKEEMLKTRRAS